MSSPTVAIAGGVASHSVPVSSPSAPGRAPTAPSYEHNPPLLDAAPRPRALAPSRRKFEWTAETAFLMASIGGLVAICVLLRTQDGALLTEWTLPLSLNTFLALLSLLSRSSLAYCMTSSLGQEKWNKFRRQASPMADFVAIEEASHGPMGSLALLWWSKLRRGPLATSAALVTILLLAVDPFIQALVSYEGQLDAVVGAVSSIAWASVLQIGASYPAGYAISAGNYPGTETALMDRRVVVDEIMRAVSVSSFSNTSTPAHANLPLACDTGNCTWAPFPTVGVCSSCVDISQHLIKAPYIGLSNNCGGEMPDQRAPVSRYTVSYGGASIDFDYGIDQGNMTLAADGAPNPSMCRYESRVQTMYSSRPNGTITFQNSSTLIFSMALLNISDEFWSNTTVETFNNAHVSLTECSLFFCTQVLKASAESGSFTENITFWSAEREPASFNITGMEFTGLNSENATLDHKLVDGDLGLSLDQRFYGGYAAIWRTPLQLYLPPAGVAALSGASGEVPAFPQRFNITANAIASFQLSLTSDSAQTAIKRALDASHDFSATFARAARIITNQLRGADPRRSTVQGTANRWAVHVRVRWPYLAFPAVVVLAGAVVLVAAALSTRLLRMEALKTDAAAVMLFGLDEEARGLIRGELAELGGKWRAEKRKAGEALVSLEDGADGMLELKVYRGGGGKEGNEYGERSRGGLEDALSGSEDALPGATDDGGAHKSRPASMVELQGGRSRNHRTYVNIGQAGLSQPQAY